MRFGGFVRCGVRDPRLQEERPLADATRREASARRLSEVEADRAEVDGLLVDWWSEVLSHDSLGEQETMDHIERLRTQCSALSSKPQELALTALGVLIRATEEVDRSVGARLLGESAATAVRRTTTAVELDRAVRFLAGCWEAVKALQEALLRSPAWPASTKTLSVGSVPVDDLRGRQFDRAPCSELLVDEERQARERGVSAYFWGHHSELPLNETSLVRLSLVARRDWADLAIEADALPLRGFRDWLWFYLHLDDDRESILALLRAAPPVFAGGAWTGSTSALAALRASIRHAERLHERLSQATRGYRPAPDAEAKLKALEEEELPAWLREVAEVAIARSDGRDLLTVFGASLVENDLRPPWSGRPMWPASHHALCAIHAKLAPKPTVAQCQHLAEVGGVPSNRTTIDRATYLITSAVFDADPKGVWAWYRELLRNNDDDLCWQARSCRRRAICYFALAERLGQLPDPFGEWRSAWKTLFVTDRERARFTRTCQNALHPSLHLLRVAVELLRQSPSRNDARRFLGEVLECTRILLESYASRFNPLNPEFALDALDVAVCIPGADWRTVVGRYRTLLTSATNRIYVATLLLEAGAPFGEVESALEVAPHRLLDTVAELRGDINFAHLCEFVSEAAERHEPKQVEEASAP